MLTTEKGRKIIKEEGREIRRKGQIVACWASKKKKKIQIRQ